MQRSVEGLRVTPWADWSEWWDVKEMLVSGNVREANGRVQCYLVRRRQAVPVAMITTVNLRYLLEHPSQDEYSQRLCLAMALVRFVNGMTDRLQPRGEGAFAKSVHSLSVELKLPLILVEIRHQASHNSLPRLTALELGARKALEWLEEFYWKAQYQEIQHHLDNTPQGLKHIFLRESESEDPSSNVALWKAGSETNGPIDGMSEEDDTFVLRKLKVLSSGIVESMRSRKDAACVESEHPWSSAEQWAECENREEWKVTPIGLIPGQKRTPGWPTKSTERIDNDANHEVSALETLSFESADVRNTTPWSTTSEPPQKLIKQLSPSDAAKVSEMTSYYEKLLKAHTTI